MSKDWLNTTDDGLLTQASDFSAIVTAGPVLLGLTAADATALAADVTTYSTKLAISSNPSTKTPVATEEKRTAAAVLIARLRSYGRRIQANPSVSDGQRVALGLTVKQTHPTPIPAPSTRPVFPVTKVSGRTVSARLADELTPNRRAKPFGVSEAEIFSFVGAAPPSELSDWTYEGQASKSDFACTFGAELPAGTKVWICARWCNRRGEPGPVSNAFSAEITNAVAA